jgi:Flp pilus assembly pilin Flp
MTRLQLNKGGSKEGIRRWIGQEDGASLVEYSLLLTLVFLVALVGVLAFGGGVNAVFGFVQDNLLPAFG